MSRSDGLYDDYVAFKGWEGDPSSDSDQDFAALVRLSGCVAGSLMDVGFGRGELLDWARAAGFSTSGVELIPELVERAVARGHDARRDLSAFPAETFDVVTAVDVLEHLSTDHLRSLLTEVRRVLRREGIFVARFPNGQSPFSGAYQNGDLTHVRALTPSAVRQATVGTGMSVISAHNFRSAAPGLRGLKHALAYTLRDLIEIIIGYVYLGHRVPMDPNIVVVLRATD